MENFYFIGVDVSKKKLGRDAISSVLSKNLISLAFLCEFPKRTFRKWLFRYCKDKGFIVQNRQLLCFCSIDNR